MPVFENENCIEWLLLGSGDVTSQGFGQSGPCPAAQQDFPASLMDSAEGPYYGLAVPPIFKNATDLPAGETPEAQGWAALLGYQYPTAGKWERTLIRSSIGSRVVSR